jgi:hypothetical protein
MNCSRPSSWLGPFGWSAALTCRSARHGPIQRARGGCLQWNKRTGKVRSALMLSTNTHDEELVLAKRCRKRADGVDDAVDPELSGSCGPGGRGARGCLPAAQSMHRTLSYSCRVCRARVIPFTVAAMPLRRSTSMCPTASCAVHGRRTCDQRDGDDQVSSACAARCVSPRC